jgi:hypothetical protein
MAESPQNIQVAPVEVPVLIQGSRTIDGTDMRELFVEKTKTTLVFENGAVLNLKSKVLPGQCVFLRNVESGKEVLCKVLEWRQQGDSGYADLEFTAYEPEFWSGQSEESSAADQKSSVQKLVEEAVANLAAKRKVELSAPALEAGAPADEKVEAPASEKIQSAALELTSPSDPLPETRQASPGSASAAQQDAARNPQAVTFSEEHVEHPGRAVAESDRATGLETPAEGPRSEVLETAEDPAALQADEATEYVSEGPRKKWRLWSPKPRAPRPPNFRARKIAAAVSVTTAVVVISVQAYKWQNSFGSFFIHTSQRPAAAATRENKATRPLTTAGAERAAAASPIAREAGNSSASPNPTPLATANGQKRPETTLELGHGLADTAVPPAASAPNQATTYIASATAKRAMASGEKHRRANAPDNGNFVPAQIVADSQPPIPPWAKGLDLDGAVTLDAVIDEKGNLASLKPLSGPPILQKAAERAVALWIFLPATEEGTPTSSHMVLTVQFQR